jgi:hypothetical protein
VMCWARMSSGTGICRGHVKATTTTRAAFRSVFAFAGRLFHWLLTVGLLRLRSSASSPLRNTPICSGSRQRHPTSSRHKALRPRLGNNTLTSMCQLPSLSQLLTYIRDLPRWLVYNLSPSFNWAAHGFSEQDLKNFIWDLGKAGFVLQLISLAGLHSTATITCESRFGVSRVPRLS